jgi:beta-lactamase class A
VTIGLGGRVALVTGSGRGLGRAYALALARLGCSVVVNSPPRPGGASAPAVAEEIEAAGGIAAAHVGSVADAEGARAAVDAALAAFGRLDVLVVNAGVVVNKPFLETTEDDLEAMIAHSDNTATDAAMRRVGAERIRELVAEAGLGAVRFGDTTRLFSSHVLGTPAGVDLGWPGIVRDIERPTLPRRPLLNDVATLAGSARDFVAWYEPALAGQFFRRPETLVEFRRVLSMSEQIALAVPPDTVAYAKGGEIPAILGTLNAKSFAGQMVVGGGRRVPVTFVFLLNWDGPAEQFPAVEARYFAAVRGVLEVLKRRFE